MLAEMGSVAVVVEERGMSVADVKVSRGYQHDKFVAVENQTRQGRNGCTRPADDRTYCTVLPQPACIDKQGNEAERTVGFQEFSLAASRPLPAAQPNTDQRGLADSAAGEPDASHPRHDIDVAAAASRFSGEEAQRFSHINNSSSQDSSRQKLRNRHPTAENGTYYVCSDNVEIRGPTEESRRHSDRSKSKPSDHERSTDRDIDKRVSGRESPRNKDSDKEQRYRRASSHTSYSHTASEKDYSTKRKRSPSPDSRRIHRRSPRRRSISPLRYPCRPHSPYRPRSPGYRRAHSPMRGHLPPPDRLRHHPPYPGRGPSPGPPLRYSSRPLSPPPYREMYYPDDPWSEPPYRGRGPPAFDRSPPRGPPLYMDGPGYERRRPPPPDPDYPYSPPRRRPPPSLQRRGHPSPPPRGSPHYLPFDRRGPYPPPYNCRSPPLRSATPPIGYHPRSSPMYSRRPRWTPSRERGPSRGLLPSNGGPRHPPRDVLPPRYVDEQLNGHPDRRKEWSARSGWDVPPHVSRAPSSDPQDRSAHAGNGVHKWRSATPDRDHRQSSGEPVNVHAERQTPDSAVEPPRSPRAIPPSNSHRNSGSHAGTGTLPNGCTPAAAVAQQPTPIAVDFVSDPPADRHTGTPDVATTSPPAPLQMTAKYARPALVANGGVQGVGSRVSVQAGIAAPNGSSMHGASIAANGTLQNGSVQGAGSRVSVQAGSAVPISVDSGKDGVTASGDDAAASSLRRGVSLDNKCWYYMDPQGQTQGPCSISQFQQWIRLLSEKANLQTEYEQFKSVSVWREGMAVRVPLMVMLNTPVSSDLPADGEAAAAPGV